MGMTFLKCLFSPYREYQSMKLETVISVITGVILSILFFLFIITMSILIVKSLQKQCEKGRKSEKCTFARRAERTHDHQKPYFSHFNHVYVLCQECVYGFGVLYGILYVVLSRIYMYICSRYKSCISKCHFQPENRVKVTP